MEIRLTAQLIESDRKAILAYSVRTQSRGPDGETHVSVLLRTSDGGITWSRLPLVRTILDQFVHWDIQLGRRKQSSNWNADHQGFK